MPETIKPTQGALKEPPVIICDIRPWETTPTDETLIAVGDGRGKLFLSVTKQDYGTVAQHILSKVQGGYTQKNEQGFRGIVIDALSICLTEAGKSAILQGKLHAQGDSAWNRFDLNGYIDHTMNPTIKTPASQIFLNLLQIFGYAMHKA